QDPHQHARRRPPDLVCLVLVDRAAADVAPALFFAVVRGVAQGAERHFDDAGHLARVRAEDGRPGPPTDVRANEEAADRDVLRLERRDDLYLVWRDTKLFVGLAEGRLLERGIARLVGAA